LVSFRGLFFLKIIFFRGEIIFEFP